MSISVVIVDDHPLVVEAILGLLHRTRNDFKLAGIGANAGDVVDLCKRKYSRNNYSEYHDKRPPEYFHLRNKSCKKCKPLLVVNEQLDNLYNF